MIRKIDYKDWQLITTDKLSENQAKTLFDAIANKNYTTTEPLKVHHRSTVLRIAWQKQDLVLKIPTEKNTKPWIRFMTWFRMGEAHKNIAGMNKLWDKGIKTTAPLLAAEKRNLGMVVDSWLVYEYLDGTTCLDKEETYPLVVKKLTQMHAAKLLHGDPQIRNFIAYKDDIYVIDSNPKHVGWAFSRAYEWAYLRKSAPGIENYFGKINNWWLYRFAYWYDIYERRFVRNRRKVKRFLLGRS
ncbi:hypothetical protein E1176_06455 [Fulvivirga sp. RKSG066]|uniref:lipopolysaccharide core heptose(II) kinase RfaY n=1 Tax=Fulvivirga aurantia TaxID=2529383 RepID=UPI0012BBC4DC|nr:lipopolysaccharide core heptose(II) kinase RfaY [Fulvivirga aurantia]MTI20656.1 hypothetical protein [Fulvivirga aurantia]